MVDPLQAMIEDTDKALERARQLYPRVSDIIGMQTERAMRNIPIENLVNAATRGQRIHEYCDAIVKRLFVADVEPEYEPYVSAFRSWFDENVAEVHCSEVRMYDDAYKYTGQIDLICTLKSSPDTLIVVDYKTSSAPSLAWPVQLAAYMNLGISNGYDINLDGGINLHLKKNTKGIIAKVIDYQDPEYYFRLFREAMSMYNYFNKKEPKNGL